jgi:hypothetical protein
MWHGLLYVLGRFYGVHMWYYLLQLGDMDQ